MKDIPDNKAFYPCADDCAKSHLKWAEAFWLLLGSKSNREKWMINISPTLWVAVDRWSYPFFIKLLPMRFWVVDLYRRGFENRGISLIKIDVNLGLYRAGVCDTPLLCCIPNFFLIICLYGCFSFPFPLLWVKGCPADGFSNSCDMTVTFQTTFYEQTYGCSVFFSL